MKDFDPSWPEDFLYKQITSNPITYGRPRFDDMITTVDHMVVNTYTPPPVQNLYCMGHHYQQRELDSTKRYRDFDPASYAGVSVDVGHSCSSDGGDSC